MPPSQLRMANTKTKFSVRPKQAMAGEAVVEAEEGEDENHAEHRGALGGVEGVTTEAGADGLFFAEGDGGGQGASFEHEGEAVGVAEHLVTGAAAAHADGG